MAPVRTNDTQPEASSSTKQTKYRSQRRFHQSQPGKESAAPGVSKIKASLRQTRRLLSKDSLAADVRVETERRLKALEAELVQAEYANKERAMAIRYHKIKFFERQKVTRKITQLKKQLVSETRKSSKKKLTKVLHELRVDLNYVLHYPKLKKYISLFPPEVRQGDVTPQAPEEDAAKTAQAREEVRTWIRSCMEKGELPTEPELQEGPGSKTKVKHKDWGGSENLKKSGKTKGKTQPVQETEEADDIDQDDFFGDDEES